MTIKSSFLSGTTLLLVAAASQCHGAVVTWGAATTITGDLDVSVLGTLNRAFTFGDVGVSATTVNGVLFSAFEITSTPTTVGTTTFSSNGGVGSFNGFGSASAPFTDLSAGYESLIGTGVFGSAADTLTLTLSGLTQGQLYQIQWWVNDSRVAAGPHRQSVAMGGGGLSVTLEHNVQNVEGGVGQYAIGTFTADATSQTIQITGATTGVTGPSPQISGFQLRAIPEPGTSALMLAAGTVFLGVTRRARRWM